MENAPSPPQSPPETPAVHQINNSSSSLYFDAFSDFQFHNLHPLPSPGLQPPSLHGLHQNPSDLDFPLFNGDKPPWGWDYVLAFKIPRYLKSKQSDTPSPVSPNEGHPVSEDGKDSPERDVDRTTGPGTRKDRKLVRKRVEILSRLKSAGFVFSQILVPSAKAIFVRISMPEHSMKDKAIELGMELKLKPEYGGGYLTFSRERESVFVNADKSSERRCYFAPADRSIIILGVLQSKEHWGCALNIEELVHEGTLLQAFAVHSNRERNLLIAETVWKRIWDPTYLPPFEAMKDYLGGTLLADGWQRRCRLDLVLLEVPSR